LRSSKELAAAEDDTKMDSQASHWGKIQHKIYKIFPLHRPLHLTVLLNATAYLGGFLFTLHCTFHLILHNQCIVTAEFAVLLGTVLVVLLERTISFATLKRG